MKNSVFAIFKLGALFFFSFLQISFESRANEFSSQLHVEQDSSGALILSGESCTLLGRQVNALKLWSEKLGEKRNAQSICWCETNGCHQEITNYVPEFVLKHYGMTADYGGPNCWNAVLVAEKIITGLRYSTPEEMSFWMDSPVCRELKTIEPLLPGDIMAIRHLGEGEVHGFIYLTPELTFSKNAYYRNAAYLLQNPDLIFNRYGSPEGCRDRESANNPNCKNYTTYYRCETLKKYLAVKKQRISPDYYEFEREVDRVERQIVALIFQGRTNTALKSKVQQSLVTAKSYLQALRPIAIQQFFVSRWSDDEVLLRQGLLIRIEALLHQVEFP